MKKFAFPENITIHPLLFALHPVLFLYQININKVNPGDIILPLVLAFSGAVVLWALLSIVTRRIIKAGLTVSLLLILFFSYGHVFALTRDKVVFQLMVNHRLLLPLWSGLFLIASLLIWRSSARYLLINKAANFISGLLVLLCAATIAVNFWGKSDNKSGLMTNTTSAAPGSIKTISSSTLPDVYFITLDSYAGGTTLEEFYHESNGDFINALKTRKFYVANQSYSNYDNTMPSLASTLNMAYINNVYAEDKSAEKQFVRLAAMIDNSAAAGFLKSKGYQIHFINSPAKPKQLDFVDMLFDTTALAYWHTRGAYRRHALSTFEELRNVIKVPGPKFVFAHSDVPHSPFVFGANCQPINAGFTDKKPDGTEKSNRYYLDQLFCVNKLVLPLIDEILTQSPVKPVIVLAADHGLPVGTAGVPSGAIRNRLNIINAYYLPEGISTRLYNSISPVNTFRFIIGQYFGGGFPLLPDEHYTILWSKLSGKLTKVDTR
ncbi:MAG: sulfatase-like hydrolase/transferase [Elusimicrobiota bacterium]